MNGMGYVQARKMATGEWKLFYVGTQNQPYPGKLFASAGTARRYHAVQLGRLLRQAAANSMSRRYAITERNGVNSLAR